MVAIGDEVVVQGGTRRSVAVPVSVPAGMKWQAVKKETTVDTASKQEEKLVEKPGRTAVDKDYRQNVPKNAKRPVPQPSPEPKPAPRGGAADEDDDRPGKKKSVDREDEESGDVDFGSATPTQAPPRDVAATGSIDSAEVMVRSEAPSGMFGRRLRLTTSFAGGFARSRGDNAGLVALGARLEFGRSLLAGIDASLLVVGGDDIRGRVMLSFAKYGVTRYLELGAAAGAEFGAGFGPAGAISLRYHLPPAPRAAAFLRYDAAYLAEDQARRGQHQLTLGVEWGF